MSQEWRVVIALRSTFLDVRSFHGNLARSKLCSTQLAFSAHRFVFRASYPKAIYTRVVASFAKAAMIACCHFIASSFAKARGSSANFTAVLSRISSLPRIPSLPLDSRRGHTRSFAQSAYRAALGLRRSSQGLPLATLLEGSCQAQGRCDKVCAR